MPSNSARYPLHVLLGLSLMLGVGLGIAVLVHSPEEHLALMALCSLAWDEVVRHAPAWRVVLPFLVLLAMVVNGVWSVGHQLLATNRLRGLLAPLRIHPPACVLTVATRLDLTGHLDILQSDALFVFCYGLLQPRICLTTGLVNLLDEDELEAVLLHERHHVRQRDPLALLISRALAHSLTFLPLAHQVFQTFLVAKELAADRHAIDTQGHTTALASALLKLGRQGQGWPWGSALVMGLNVTRERITQLLRAEPVAPPRPTSGALLTSFAIILTLFAVSYTPLVLSRQESVWHSECPGPSQTLPHPHSH